MVHHRDAIFRDADIELNARKPKAPGERKTLQRVLRQQSARAAMPKNCDHVSQHLFPWILLRFDKVHDRGDRLCLCARLTRRRGLKR